MSSHTAVYEAKELLRLCPNGLLLETGVVFGGIDVLVVVCIPQLHKADVLFLGLKEVAGTGISAELHERRVDLAAKDHWMGTSAFYEDRPRRSLRRGSVAGAD